MKLYIWYNPGNLKWGDGIVAVVASNLTQAKAKAREIYDSKDTFHNLDHVDDIGKPDEIRDLSDGVGGVAFTFEM